MGYLTDDNVDRVVDKLVREQHGLEQLDAAHDERLRLALRERKNFRRSRAGRDERRKRANPTATA